MYCKKITWLFLSITIGISSCNRDPDSLTRYVDPFIGTGGHGHTYPGVSLPFGMIQLSPDTRLDGWDGCSGYHAEDTVIYGFSHTHLSGTGCLDYGDILVMPVTGIPDIKNYAYASGFKTASEVAHPGYYKVYLDKYQVTAELTATLRTGFHRYTFPESEQSDIIFDLKHRDKVLESGLKIVSDNEIEGYRISQSWAQKQMIYFVARFSKSFTAYSLFENDTMIPVSKPAEGTNIKSVFTFRTGKDEQICVKVGISAVSTEGARKNLTAEIPGWNFGEIAETADREWNKELGKITIEGGTNDQKVIFYTALYHALLNPNLYTDTDRQYRGRDLQVYTTGNFDYYTLFSLWDTYRATHPLLTILDEKRTGDFIRTFIQQYQEGGMLPVWELSANETGCMIGYHAVPVIYDAYQKGIRNFDAGKAFEAMKNSAEQDHLGLRYYRSEGYIPGDKEGESVSRTLEYAYDDWCIAEMARELGKKEDHDTYIQRAQYYKNIFDPSSGFMRAKMNETWFTPFDPAEVNFNYTEANSWQYSFYVPQDIEGLINLSGGKEKFGGKLDALFTSDSKTTGREQVDISGLIGQYAHGNEPSHHIAYLYNFIAQPWKTQELVHRICSALYSNQRDGLCGNEDCGQMSSWYIFSAMGFYPVTPGSGNYIIGTPMFPKITIHLENGKTFSVIARGISDKNFYIQSARLNGKTYTRSYLRHQDIMKGGKLEFEMGPEPNKSWGSSSGDIPVSAITRLPITIVPSIEQGNQTFFDSVVVCLSTPQQGATIFYTLDGTEPTMKSEKYIASLTLKKSTTVHAFATLDGKTKSFTIESRFFKIPKNRKIKLNSRYSSQYSGGGNEALINFIKGEENFRTGCWQGYEGVDLDAVIDLGSIQPIRKLSLGCIQDIGSWIFFPTRVEYYLSADGKLFHEAGIVENQISEKREDAMRMEFALNIRNETARYVKVIAKNRQICPPWHAGAGGKAWIFVDELMVD